MDAIILQTLNGLDKGSAYALIALGLTLIFGTLGVVNFAHGAMFMIGAFCAVTMQRILHLSYVTLDPTKKDFLGNPLKVQTPYVEHWFGHSTGAAILDWSVPLSLLLAVPVMVALGFVMERGLIKQVFGANPISTPAPHEFAGALDFGALIGFPANTIVYPYWRLIYFLFSAVIIGGVFSFLQFTTFGMVVRAGMADRETVGLLGINIDRRFTIMFGLAAAVAGLAGAMYAPINSPNYHMGMDFLVLSFVVVVVGGMGSLPGAVAAGFLLGVLESYGSMNAVKELIPGIDQIIIYVIAIVVLLTRPRGLMGRKGVMED
jgi:branched-subunit amino acid ABC-type transport system permease component